MQLDVTSILIVATMMVALLTIAMIYFYLQDRRAKWLGWAVVPLVSGIAAMLLFSLRGTAPDYIGKGVGTAVIFVCNGTLWQAMRAFDRRKVMLWPVAIAPTIWLLLATNSAFMANTPLRIAVASITMSFFCGLASWELWRGRAEALPSRNAAIAVLAGLSAAHWTRIPFMNVLPFPLGGLPTTPMAVGGMVAIIAVVALFMTLLMISMTKERLELAQRNIAVTDPLTGLLNRRAFADEADRRARHATGAAVPATLLVLDLDRFKAINDRYGHEAGDLVLLNFARVMRTHARSEDMLFRMGGEEFCFLLPGVGAEGGEALAQRMCRVFGNSFVSTDSGDIRATVSIGVATGDTDDVAISSLLAAADAALYEAKNSGRDQVVSARTAEIVRLPDTHALRELDRRRA